jgi:hypothetical protein
MPPRAKVRLMAGWTQLQKSRGTLPFYTSARAAGRAAATCHAAPRTGDYRAYLLLSAHARAPKFGSHGTVPPPVFLFYIAFMLIYLTGHINFWFKGYFFNILSHILSSFLNYY